MTYGGAVRMLPHALLMARVMVTGNGDDVSTVLLDVSRTARATHTCTVLVWHPCKPDVHLSRPWPWHLDSVCPSVPIRRDLFLFSCCGLQVCFCASQRTRSDIPWILF